MIKCLNCQTAVAEKYCPQCGQSSNVGKITFKETFDNFLSSSFSLEGPFLYTIKSLVIHPGIVFKEYLAGQRKKYYKPVAFFILITAMYILLRALLDYNPLEYIKLQETDAKFDEVKRKSMEASQYMVKNINNIMFLLVFAIGIMMKLFYRKRYYLAEYLALGFYISGLYVLAGIVTMVISNYSDLSLNYIQLGVLVGLIVYCAISFFNPKSFWGFIKIVTMSVLGLFLYMLLGYGFSFMMVN